MLSWSAKNPAINFVKPTVSQKNYMDFHNPASTIDMDAFVTSTACCDLDL